MHLISLLKTLFLKKVDLIWMLFICGTMCLFYTHSSDLFQMSLHLTALLQKSLLGLGLFPCLNMELPSYFSFSFSLWYSHRKESSIKFSLYHIYPHACKSLLNYGLNLHKIKSEKFFFNYSFRIFSLWFILLRQKALSTCIQSTSPENRQAQDD